MDRDSGDHVWNYSFHGATLKSGVPLTGEARKVDAGHNGPVGENTKLIQYEMDVRFGESNWPRTYKYWLELMLQVKRSMADGFLIILISSGVRRSLETGRVRMIETPT